MKSLLAAFPNYGYFERLSQNNLQADYTENLNDLRSLILAKRPDLVSFFASPEKALEQWARKLVDPTLPIASIGPLTPQFHSFLEQRPKRWVELSRDPDELLETDFSKYSALMISNPSLLDSYFSPQVHTDVLAEHLKKFKQLQILSEESTLEFYRNQGIPQPGSLVPHLNPKISVLSGCFGYSNDAFSWLIDGATRPEDQARQQTRLQQGGAFRHRVLAIPQAKTQPAFKRRLFVMEHNLPRFIQSIRPLILDGLVSIPYWPKPRALYLCMDVSKVLDQRRMTSSELCRQLKDEHGLHLLPGSSFARPNMVRVCLASPISHLTKIGRAILAGLS